MAQAGFGVSAMLSGANARIDGFLRDRLGVDAAASGFKRDGRFSLGGLIAILSMGANDRQRTAPDRLTLSALDSPIVEAALARLHSPVTADEAKEILELLRTGAVASDVVSALHVTMTHARRLPPDLFIDLLRLPQLPAELVQAVSDDLGTRGEEPRTVLTLLRNGRIDREILPRTLAVVLNRAAPNHVAETLRALIGPENRTVRLALLIYARAQGVDIDEDDLDALYLTIDPASPDLAPLLNQGLARLLAQSGGVSEALNVLRNLAA
jgi:hypothetical protein